MGPTGITLADDREWKCMHNMCISQSNLASLLYFIIISVSAATVSVVQIQMMVV